MPDLQLRITTETGQELIPVLQDASGEVDTYLTSLANLADIRPWGQGSPGGDSWLPQEMRWNAPAMPGLGETSPLSLKLNCIYYPTGGRRWGVGCFLVAGKWETMPAAQKVTIEFGEVTLENWWMAHCKQITPDLSLIVVADDRYRMHWTNTGDNFAFDSTSTWEEIIDQLEISLQTTITTDPCDYGLPDFTALQRRNDSALAILDAVAASRGQRVVLNFDGTITLQNAEEAKYLLSKREVVGPYAIPKDAITGKNLDPLVPASMTVSFSRSQSGAWDQTGRVYSKTFHHSQYPSGPEADALESWPATNADHAIRCTYPAEFRTLDSSPENQTELDRLACRIIRDCYRWTALAYDYTLPGIVTEVPLGSDDFIVFCIGARIPNWSKPDHDDLPQAPEDDGREYLVATRYVSRPPNALPETIYAGDGKQHYRQSGIIRAEITGEVGESTECKLVGGDLLGNKEADDRTVSVAKSNYPWITGPMPDTGRFEFLVDPDSTTTTTTTTTAQDCEGRCKFTWDGYQWEETTNECERSTTTAGATSTTTAEAASTTTCNPDDPCCALVADSTETTTTTSTTTAGPDDCRCQWPTFCLTPEDVGACTWTFCADGDSQPPSCETSTTTDGGGGTGPPTTTTSTTTAGCPAECSCEDGCDWVAVRFGNGLQWVQTNNGCGPKCPCPAPSIGIFTGVCATTHTECVPTPPCGDCSGKCTFWWIPLLSQWVATASNCSSGSCYGCNCVAPSIPGGDVCAAIETPCKVPGNGTTTADPCEDCYTTTTSTTTAGCGGCLWGCSSEEWEIISGCEPGCECSPPVFGCSEDCEIERTPCRPLEIPTTTTTAGPSTTTTTTSTTTASNCICTWTANGALEWVKTQDCPQSVGCDYCPSVNEASGGQNPPFYAGQQFGALCLDSEPGSTTTAGCPGQCQFIWSQDGSGYNQWYKSNSNCEDEGGPCTCEYPQEQGVTVGGSYSNTSCSEQPCGTCNYASEGDGNWTLEVNFCAGGCGCTEPAWTPTVKQRAVTLCESL